MSNEEATAYVDLILETLVERGFLSQRDYGRMPESLRDELAQAIVEKSEE